MELEAELAMQEGPVRLAWLSGAGVVPMLAVAVASGETYSHPSCNLSGLSCRPPVLLANAHAINYAPKNDDRIATAM